MASAETAVMAAAVLSMASACLVEVTTTSSRPVLSAMETAGSARPARLKAMAERRTHEFVKTVLICFPPDLGLPAHCRRSDPFYVFFYS